MVASDLRSPTQQVVGHGRILFENELGGRIAIVPWSADGAVLTSVQRTAQLAKVLTYLDPLNHYGWAEGGPWLVPQFLTDARMWRGVVWNSSPDELAEVIVHRPAAMPAPASAVQVNSRGERTPASICGDRVRLQHPLHQWEFLVLL